tara:strand:- start:864 stop:1808 length:945 start_codon:yes stop_codon:yes gene_type:complete
MGLFSGVASGATWALEKLGLTWVTGGATATQTLTSTSDIKVSIWVPELFPNLAPVQPVQHSGAFTLKVPDHSKVLSDMAVNMAENALNMVEMAIALQTIIDPEGGIRIKDQLDDYHYNVIKNALEENGNTVPPLKEPEASTAAQIGGAMTEFGILSNLTTAADALGAVSPLVEAYTTLPTNKFGLNPPNTAKASNGDFGIPTVGPNGPLTNNGVVGGAIPPVGIPNGDMTVIVDGHFPDYSLQYSIMASAMSIQGFIMKYAVGNFRNAIDTNSRALVIKNMLGEFSKEVSDQALEEANQEVPEWQEPQGSPGVR